MSVQFEWDRHKAEENSRKHQITFEEASTIFRDRLAYIFDDEKHSEDELREIIIGHSVNNRILLVVFTERDGRIRIISARKAESVERKAYEMHRPRLAGQ